MRPVEMSKLRIFIDQDQISALIHFLPTLQHAHVIETSRIEEETLSSWSSTFVNQMQENLKKVDVIQQNLEFISSSLTYTPKEIRDYNVKHQYETEDIRALVEFILNDTSDFRNQIEEFITAIRQRQIERENIMFNLALLQILLQFHVTPQVFDKLHHFSLLTFSIVPTNVMKLETTIYKSEITAFLYTGEFTSDRVVCVIICKSDDEADVRQLIKVTNPEYASIPYKYIKEDGVDLQSVEADFEANNQMIQQIEANYEDFRVKSIGRFLALKEMLANIQKILVIERQFVFVPPFTAILDLWTPSAEVSNNITQLTNKFQFKVRFKVTESKYADIPYEQGYGKEGRVEKTEEVPTLTKHSRFVTPFLTIIRLYGIPRYTEIDPTLFVAIVFPIFFGIMFPDVGHGMILVLVSLIGMVALRHRSQGTRDMAVILFYCGLAAIGGGFLAGEYFGIRISTVPYLQWAVVLNLFQDPFQNIVFILKISIIIGVAHISLGWLIQAANYTLSKRKYFAIADSGVKLFFLLGGTFLIFTYKFNISAWLSGPFPPILLTVIPGFLLIFTRALGKLFHVRYLAKEPVGQLLGQSSVEAMETVLSVLSNVTSYSRLLALLSAHMGLMVAVTSMSSLVASTIPGIIGQIFVSIGLILGNVMVIALETLLAFIQDLRLHFYEFFSKFYKGSGVPFKQVELANIYSEIRFRGADTTIMPLAPQIKRQVKKIPK